MFKIVKYYLLKPFFLWLLIFAIFKSFFLLFHSKLINEESFSEIIKVFTQSLKLDISSTSYVLIIPLLLAIFQFFIPTNFLKKINKYYHLLMLFFISFINVTDIVLFEYWHSKISLKSFLFLNNPSQIIASIGLEKFIMVLLFIAFHFFIGKAVLHKYLYKQKIKYSKSFISFIVFTLLSIGLIVIGLRGGLQNVPLNQSEAFYSKNNTLNYAGVNPLWNFLSVLFENRAYANTNPYIKIDKTEAIKIVENLYKVEKDTSIKILKTNRPNIVYIALEGVNANVFKAFNHEKSYAPQIDLLMKEGYLFKEMYASGFRSDQGMVSIFSGFPPTPVSSICAQAEKFTQLPSLPKQLQEKDYNCSFYFGGEASFGNFKSYLIYNGFNPLIEVDDFPKDQRTQNLGVPDEFVFSKFAEEMKDVKEPFFSMIFTQTTHEPYDMPFNKNVTDERAKYLNTVQYVDSVIGKWYQKMKKMPWYKNTIFIISSDHAHAYPGNYVGWEKERYHIPFLVFGNALKDEFKEKENYKICSQVDIPKTLLAQMDIENKDFKWSKNFLNPYAKDFAFYSFVEAYCLRTPNNTCGWEYNWEKPYGDCDSTFYQKQGQAFLQILYDDYLSY